MRKIIITYYLHGKREFHAALQQCLNRAVFFCQTLSRSGLQLITDLAPRGNQAPGKKKKKSYKKRKTSNIK